MLVNVEVSKSVWHNTVRPMLWRLYSHKMVIEYELKHKIMCVYVIEYIFKGILFSLAKETSEHFSQIVKTCTSFLQLYGAKGYFYIWINFYLLCIANTCFQLIAGLYAFKIKVTGPNKYGEGFVNVTVKPRKSGLWSYVHFLLALSFILHSSVFWTLLMF